VRIAFVSWAPRGYQSHTDLLAKHLNAQLHYVFWGKRGKLLAPARYAVQACQTWQILCRDRPDVVFVQNPPIFSALVAAFYARRYGARYVIDSHSGAFLATRWRSFLALHRVLSCGALTTIVHNRSLAEIVKQWGCRYCVLGFIPGDYPSGEHFPLDGQFNVALISSFLQDEPIDVVFEAARRIPDVRFYVTGDSNRLTPHLRKEKPDNCCLTGYLPTERYVGLLRGADAVMALTTQDHTVLMGGFEAVSLAAPLIVSDWPVLRECFSLGTVHIPNTVEGICDGVRQAQTEHAKLKRDILLLREQLQAEWERKFTDLQRLLDERPPRK
jgi:hypothetical protein